MLYVLKIKGTETIPDFVQIRDKDLTLLAYFRLSQIEKGLKKSNLEKDLEGLSLLIKKIPFGKMPYLYNPEKGVIVTANNRTIGDEFPYYISGLWADPSRSDRINDLLEENRMLGMEEMKNTQLDYQSNFALDVIPYLLDAGQVDLTEGQRVAFDYIASWDGVEDVDSRGALFFHSFF